MSNRKNKCGQGPMEKERRIDCLGDDLLQNVLSKLPALSFAHASCVSRSWNAICNRVLSRPKLSSALSLKSSQWEAFDEVLNKVFSEPIRPHFAIVYVSPSFNLPQIHKRMRKELGYNMPIISVKSYGILGRDALTDEFKEIQWEVVDEESNDGLYQSVDRSCGIALTVGFLPGIKVGVIPMNHEVKDLTGNAVDNFVTEIREYTASVSGCTSPLGIIMFGRQADMTPILEKLDCAMSSGNVIVGEFCSGFLYAGDRRNDVIKRFWDHFAVTLVFAKDRKKSQAVGEIQFHVRLSNGLSPLGPAFKAVSVREMHNGCSTWLTAKREGFQEKLDGQTILDHIYDEIGDRIDYPAFYIGVKKRRKCSIGAEKVRWATYLTFHGVQGGDQEYLFVSDIGIRTGDSFRFYIPDTETALSSLDVVSNSLEHLKRVCDLKNQPGSSAPRDRREEVFGGIIFSCCGRGEAFFERSNVDSSPFIDNFPGVALAGTYCGGEIAFGDASVYSFTQDTEEQLSVGCCLHFYSSAYFIMSYTPPLSDH